MKTSIWKKVILTSAIGWIAGCGGSAENAAIEYRQIERLARPGINEAFVLSSKKHAAFNSIAPSLDLADDPTVQSVRDDAVAVIGAITNYGRTNGLPAPTVGNVAGGFLPDVMRINTANNFSPSNVNSSATNSFPGAYASDFTGAAPTSPDVDRANPLRLTGGRMITDDVIDVTYTYLIAGLAAQIVDGVSYCGQNAVSQGHHPLTGWSTTYPCTDVRQAATFPFLAAPN